MVTCRVSRLSFTSCIHLMWRALCPLFYLSAVYVRHSPFFFHSSSTGGHCILFDSFQKLFRCCDWPFIFRCFRKIAKTDYCPRHVCLSVRPHGTTRFPLDRFSWKFVYIFFEYLSRKFNFYLKLTRIAGTLHYDLCIFLYRISLSSS
jgi:hypothetical protein